MKVSAIRRHVPVNLFRLWGKQYVEAVIIPTKSNGIYVRRTDWPVCYWRNFVRLVRNGLCISPDQTNAKLANEVLNFNSTSTALSIINVSRNSNALHIQQETFLNTEGTSPCICREATWINENLNRCVQNGIAIIAADLGPKMHIGVIYGA